MPGLEPTIESSEALNRWSAEIEHCDRQIEKFSVLINLFGDRMRENATLAAEVAFEQLEALKAAKEDVPAMRADLERRYTQLTDDYLESYRSLLGARESYIKEGKTTLLNEEKRGMLYERFKGILQKNLAQYKEEFAPTADWDPARFKSEKKLLEERVNQRRDVQDELFEQKTELTMEQEALKEQLQPQYLEAKAKRDACWKRPQVDSLHMACQVDDAAFIREQLETKWFKSTKKKLVTELSADGFAPIHYAAYHGRYAVLSRLLEYGADINQRDVMGYQAIHWAAMAGYSAFVRNLLREGAEINSHGSYGRTPLHMAVFHGRLRTAEELLETPGIDINAQTTVDGFSVTPLHNAVLNGNIAMVELLASRDDLDLNIPDRNGRSPIYDAIEKGMASIVRILWDHPKLDRTKIDASKMRIQCSERAIREILAEEKTCL